LQAIGNFGNVVKMSEYSKSSNYGEKAEII
jgi:hypothetical protein